jgi:hypothetical protein
MMIFVAGSVAVNNRCDAKGFYTSEPEEARGCGHTGDEDVMRSEGWASGRQGRTWGSEEHHSMCLAARRRRCMGRAVAVVMLAATCAPAMVLGGDLIDDLPNELIEGAVLRGTHCANASWPACVLTPTSSSLQK